MGWLKYGACLAFGLWTAPLLRPVEKVSFDDIASWAGKGPLADSDAPFMGVFLFHGAGLTRGAAHHGKERGLTRPRPNTRPQVCPASCSAT